MRNKFRIGIIAAVLTVLMAVPAFAGTWKADSHGWWYQRNDGTWPANCWEWVDGNCYCFGADGYMLSGCVTPDGYTVSKSGTWEQDGVTVYDPSKGADTTVSGGSTGIGDDLPSSEENGVLSSGNLHVAIPSGFYVDAVDNETVALDEADQNAFSISARNESLSDEEANKVVKEQTDAAYTELTSSESQQERDDYVNSTFGWGEQLSSVNVEKISNTIAGSTAYGLKIEGWNENGEHRVTRTEMFVRGGVLYTVTESHTNGTDNAYKAASVFENCYYE